MPSWLCAFFMSGDCNIKFELMAFDVLDFKLFDPRMQKLPGRFAAGATRIGARK